LLLLGFSHLIRIYNFREKKMIHPIQRSVEAVHSTVEAAKDFGHAVTAAPHDLRGSLHDLKASWSNSNISDALRDFVRVVQTSPSDLKHFVLGRH
jgi:hypothetical protein